MNDPIVIIRRVLAMGTDALTWAGRRAGPSAAARRSIARYLLGLLSLQENFDD
ncbi:hypothetical protein GG851_24290 [Bordetella petrii]|nr:hypothetical protein [Bordetella petrii]